MHQTLNSFGDLTFSPDFLERLPSELREKLGDNLHPGIALSDLEIPTTDKVLLARMLAADRLTDILSKTPVEVWITPEIQKELGELGYTTDAGLQQIDYSQLSLEAKSYLVEIMERQEFQVHTILAARNRFPNGAPPLGFSALLSGQRERTMFDSLKDLEAQYKAARQAIDNPLLLWFSEILEKSEKEAEGVKDQKAQDTMRQRQDSEYEFPINVEEEAKGDWWSPGKLTVDFRRYEAVSKKVAEFLRPKYANKTIYEILGAESPEAKEEILAAFWRMDNPRQIDFGDEPWMIYGLYVKPDGTLELHFQDSLYSERDISTVTGSLESARDVAMVDQTVKWIQEEMSKMKTVRELWAKSGFGQSPTIEVTLAAALSIDEDSALQEEIDGLPKWFMTALNQEVQYYDRLISYTPRYDLDDLFSDLFSPLDSKDKPQQNKLKSYFDLVNARLERDRRLITNPTELYKDLELDPSASQQEVKKAYRRIAQETRAIHINSPDEFDPEDWQAMNDRFIRATKAYTAISSRQLGETRVTTLGRLSTYFKTVI